MNPKITIVIPVKNGIDTIERCLDAIFEQTLIAQTEVIIIDSGSTDGTLDVLNNYDVRVYQIPPEDFSHGGTRNYGVSLARGEFVVMTVQDAWAANNQWLSVMLAHFEKDAIVAAVVGQQVAPHRKDVNPHQWYRPVSQPRVIEMYFENSNDYVTKTGEEQDKCTFYDDVNTMYRKADLETHPFEVVEFGEDMLAIKTFLSNRRKVIYDCNSSVWHYHFLSKDYVYKVTFTLLYQLNKIFQYTPQISYSLKDYLFIIYRNFKYKVPLKWILHNFNILKYHERAYRDFMMLQEKGEVALEKYYRALNPHTVQGKQL